MNPGRGVACVLGLGSLLLPAAGGCGPLLEPVQQPSAVSIADGGRDASDDQDSAAGFADPSISPDSPTQGADPAAQGDLDAGL